MLESCLAVLPPPPASSVGGVEALGAIDGSASFAVHGPMDKLQIVEENLRAAGARAFELGLVVDNLQLTPLKYVNEEKLLSGQTLLQSSRAHWRFFLPPLSQPSTWASQLALGPLATPADARVVAAALADVTAGVRGADDRLLKGCVDLQLAILRCACYHYVLTRSLQGAFDAVLSLNMAVG